VLLRIIDYYKLFMVKEDKCWLYQILTFHLYRNNLMMLKAALPLYLIVVLIAACNTGKRQSAMITDDDFREFYRIYSPNKSKLLLNYGAHHEAFGYAIRGTAILKMSDTSGNLVKFTLPNTLGNFKWKGKDTVNASFDIINSLRNGTKVTAQDTVVNGVFVKVKTEDYIDDSDQLQLLHRETSPNGKQQLLVYRYGNRTDSTKFIHIAVVAAHAAVPRYGNYFIAQAQNDYILYARWSRNNTLILFTNNEGKELIYYGLVRPRPTVDYQIVADNDRYKNAKKWVGR
jgi:hypothetical protein